MGSAKDKHGVRERSAQKNTREEWPFPDKGIVVNHHMSDKQDQAEVF